LEFYMSTNTSIFDFYPPASPQATAGAAPAPREVSRVGAGSLSVLLLAALVAALVLLADRFVSAWADEHLFLGWVLLWVVIFAGLALFAGTARSLAARAIRALDGWSQARAQARAEARLWMIARSDPRVMADLTAIRVHAERDNDSNFSMALAPMGIEPLAQEPAARGWVAYIERMGQGRIRNMHLHYV
jgi:hypothetical protein